MHEATEAALVDDRVAGKAGVVHRLVGGFVVVKVSEPPAAGRGVLDHKLNPVLEWPGHERLETAKGFATFLQRDVIPGEPGNDGAVREWKLPFPVGLDRVAATVAALAQISGAAPAGSTANVVDADVSLVKPLPCTEQFGKRGQAVPPSLSETTHGPWH